MLADYGKVRHPYRFVVSAVFLCALITIWMSYYYKTEIVYTHLFYIPIILASIWYPKYAIPFAASLGLFHIAFSYFFTEEFSPWTFIRAVMFIAVAWTTSSLVIKHDRSQAENLKLASEIDEQNRFEKIFINNAAQMTLHSLSDGRFTDANNAFLKNTGLAKEDVLGKTPDQLGISVDESDLLEIEKRLKEDGCVRDLEMQVQMKNGKRIDGIFSIDSFNIKEEKHYMVVMTDITDRKRAEEALKREREEKIELFDYINSIVYVADTESYEILYANKFMEKAFGEALRGSLCHEAMQGLREPCDFCTNEALKELDGESYKWDFHNPSNGCYYEMTDRLIRWRDGRLVRLGIAHDITERKKAEIERELKERQLREFMDMASHELKHPTTLIKGFAELLSEYHEEVDQKTVKQALNALIHGTERLDGIVEDFLNVSRIEKGNLSVKLREENIDLILEEFLTEMKRRFPDTVFEIEKPYPIGNWKTDALKLKEIMVILCENAVKYGNKSEKIGIKACVSGESLRIMILDRGPGISQAHREKIFDKFFQIKAEDDVSSTGLGLGLYIAHEIMKAHGGKIYYDDRQGGGSIFTLEFFERD